MEAKWDEMRQMLTLPEHGIPRAEWRRRFLAALEDDLNLPRAIAAVWDLLRRDRETPPGRKLALLLDFDQVLGRRPPLELLRSLLVDRAKTADGVVERGAELGIKWSGQPWERGDNAYPEWTEFKAAVLEAAGGTEA